ncbi:hypothetical protein LCGC14_0974480, partial [marine sediment metagenome]
MGRNKMETHNSINKWAVTISCFLLMFACAAPIGDQEFGADVIFSTLTANRLMATGSSKEATSVSDLTSWIAGTTDRISVADDSDGTVTIDLATNTQTLLDYFNGIFLETLDFTISEAGGTVTGSLEQDSGGDLKQRFSDGYTTLDCTPALTIDLTAFVGTNPVPKEVFVYILKSAKTAMAASNSDWPATEHAKVANLLLKSAATTGADGGALVNRNWNDHTQDDNSQGHNSDITQRIRQEPTQHNSGVALTLKNSGGTELTTTNSSTAVELVTTAGTVYQLHKQTFPAFDMFVVATDDAHIVNQPTDEGGAYETTADLVTDVTHYVDGSASGVAIGTNKYFNLVIWGVQNRSGEPSHIMINLPTSQYNTESDATSDIDGTSVFDIPAAFKGAGFLVARLTFRKIAGPQWTYIAQEDLRGQFPSVSAGVGVQTTDHALLANLDKASAGHTDFQTQGDVLDDLNTLGAVGADSEFLVGTGAGTLAWENASTARTSLGVGTGDSPTWAGAIFNGDVTFDGTDAGKDWQWDASANSFVGLDNVIWGQGNTAAAPDVWTLWDGDSWEWRARITGTTPWNIGTTAQGIDINWLTTASGDFVHFDWANKIVNFTDVDLKIGSETFGGKLFFGANNTIEYDATNNDAVFATASGRGWRIDGALKFTQVDGNEFTNSLADGYMDYGATIAHRFNNSLVVDSTTLVVNASGYADRVGIGTASPGEDLEIQSSSPILRLRDTGATASATNAFVEFGGTDAAAWSRTGYVGDGSSGNTTIYLVAEIGDLHLGDSSGIDVLNLQGGNVGIGLTTIDANYKLIVRRAADINLGVGLQSSELAIAAFNDALSANIP